MNGKCLCGEVQFSIKGTVPNFYQCHCSQCRRITGTSSNTATFISKANLDWLSGENIITRFSTATGFRSSFCSVCGSPVPNIIRGTDIYWVPAGSLDGEIDSRIVSHLFTHSKAPWDDICSAGRQYAEMPDIATLEQSLQR